MGALDRLEDGFPHGTPDGYRQGCKGSHCPEGDAGRLSCMQAYTRYQSDFGYRRRVDEGMTPVQLWEFDQKVAEEKRSLVTKAPQSAPEPEPASDVDPVRAAAIAHAETTGISYEKHGTTGGYSAGCRDKESCPGFERVGKSCTQAVNEYQRDLKRRRREAARVGKVDAPVGLVQERAEPRSVLAQRATDADVEAEKDRRVDEATAELRKAHSEAVGRAVAAEAELAAARETNAAQAERISELEQILTESGAINSQQARRITELRDRVASLEIELDVARAGYAVETRRIGEVEISQPVPVPSSPSRFRFARDEAGGVVVDVDGEQPGFVRFDLDESGALVGVAVQSGK